MFLVGSFPTPFVHFLYNIRPKWVFEKGLNCVGKLAESFQSLNHNFMTRICQKTFVIWFENNSERIVENCTKNNLLKAEKMTWTHGPFQCSNVSLLLFQPNNWIITSHCTVSAQYRNISVDNDALWVLPDMLYMRKTSLYVLSLFIIFIF